MPLRPDFSIDIEIYCLQTGVDAGGSNSSGSGSFGAHHHFGTPLSRSVRSSALTFSPLASSAKRCLGLRGLLSSAKSRKQKSTPSAALYRPSNDLSATAFTLLSSVQVRYTDDLLYGRYPPSRQALFSSNVSEAEVLAGVEMPLVLMGLPRSTPLTGRVGMCDVAVRLQSSILKRGFLVSAPSSLHDFDCACRLLGMRRALGDSF